MAGKWLGTLWGRTSSQNLLSQTFSKMWLHVIFKRPSNASTEGYAVGFIRFRKRTSWVAMLRMELCQPKHHPRRRLLLSALGAVQPASAHQAQHLSHLISPGIYLRTFTFTSLYFIHFFIDRIYAIKETSRHSGSLSPLEDLFSPSFHLIFLQEGFPFQNLFSLR